MRFTTRQSLKAFKLVSFKGTHADGICVFDEGPDEDENASIRSLVIFGRNFTPG